MGVNKPTCDSGITTSQGRKSSIGSQKWSEMGANYAKSRGNSWKTVWPPTFHCKKKWSVSGDNFPRIICRSMRGINTSYEHIKFALLLPHHMPYTLSILYIYIYTFICIYVCMFRCICVYVYMYICICIYVYMYICVFVYVYMYICIYVYICIHMYTYVYICIHMYMYVYVYIYILYINVPEHIYIYILHINVCVSTISFYVYINLYLLSYITKISWLKPTWHAFVGCFVVGRLSRFDGFSPFARLPYFHSF